MSRTIDEYFAMMPAAFQSDLAAGLVATYQFDLSGDGGGKWFVVIRSGEVEIGRAEKQNPDVGRMNSILALATGKFKIKGHMGLAMKL